MMFNYMCTESIAHPANMQGPVEKGLRTTKQDSDQSTTTKLQIIHGYHNVVSSNGNKNATFFRFTCRKSHSQFISSL